MKPGTLVHHFRWGNAIVLEMKGNGRFPVAMVRWLKPVTTPSGVEKVTSSVYVTELTTISGAE
jgi:hypothetical protein